MTRSQDRNRKKAKGIPLTNFKSKTCPSTIKARQLRDEEYDIGRILPRRHTARTKFKASLGAAFGVPPDSKFLFRHSSKDREDGAYKVEEYIKINFGTTVVVNKQDTSLVLVVRCNEFKKMTAEERGGYCNSISTPYLHARARNTCLLHSSIQTLILACIVWGWMGCCGWRGGSDPGKSVGTYSLNDFTAKDGDKIEEDVQRMTRFHKIRDFWAEKFSTLCFAVFESNIKLAKESNIPGFHEEKWQTTPNGKVFASNLVVTCDGFRNCDHTDDYDRTRYSYGMFSLIDRVTGEPYELAGSKPRGNVLGACFVLKEFGIEVDFAGCDGVVEMVWDTRVKHQSTASTAFNAEGEKIRHLDGELTRFGSSCQISESVVGRIAMLEREKEKMEPQEWSNFVNDKVKSYEQETAGRMKKITNGKSTTHWKVKSLLDEKSKAFAGHKGKRL